MDASWLDYGSLGLLAVVLGAVGLFLRNYLNREQDRAEKRDEDARDERKDLNAQFTDLVSRDVAAKQDLSRALSDLCKQIEGGQSGTVTALKAVTDRMERQEKRAEDRHVQVMAQGSEILTALKGLNGKT